MRANDLTLSSSLYVAVIRNACCRIFLLNTYLRISTRNLQHLQGEIISSIDVSFELVPYGLSGPEREVRKGTSDPHSSQGTYIKR